MPKYKLIANGTAVSNKFKKARVKIEGIRDNFLTNMAQYIISVSPVDTGTYITSHEIISGVEGSFTDSSRGKPRNQPRGPFSQEGLNRLINDISGLSPDASTISIVNNSEHGQKVEFDYGVYAKARAEAQRIANES